MSSGLVRDRLLSGNFDHACIFALLHLSVGSEDAALVELIGFSWATLPHATMCPGLDCCATPSTPAVRSSSSSITPSVVAMGCTIDCNRNGSEAPSLEALLLNEPIDDGCQVRVVDELRVSQAGCGG